MLRGRQRALAVTERMGNPSFLCFALSGMGDVFLKLGEWQEARRVLERAASLLRTADRTTYTDVLPLDLGMLALRQGDWEEASRCLGRHDPLVRRRTL
jgi:uncharacterized protein HemY